MLSRTQVLPTPGILEEQVGFSWSNRPCMHACSITLLSERIPQHTPKSRMEARAWDTHPQTVSHPNTITSQRYVIMSTLSVLLQVASYSDCLLLNSELYGDDLYAMNHDEFIHSYPSYNDLNQHEHNGEIHFCQPPEFPGVRLHVPWETTDLLSVLCP